MLSHAKKMMVENKTFMVQITLDNPTNQEAKNNYEHLCDLQILLGLICILPLLEYVHALINLHRCEMCLCATLWLLSRSTKVICITCIWNIVPISLHVPFGHSSPCLNVSMKISTWSGYLILILDSNICPLT
jgi:hypothetical protein